MAKGKRAADGVERQGRRAMPGLRKVRRGAGTRGSRITLGDLVAAAFDTAGDVNAVAALLSSRQLARAVGRRIVCV